VAGLLLNGAALGAARKVAPPPCPSGGTQATSFARALSGDSFVAADGSEIRLAGILAVGSDGPGLSSAETRGVLEARLAGKSLSLALAAPGRDRYGRLVGQVFADGIWVQEELLKAGLARAAPDIGSSACAASALAAEEAGRRARAGGWSNGAFTVATPDQLVAAAKRRAGSFQIVEGMVVTASVVGGRAYLNFGADRRTDFTVTISPDDMKNFRRAKFDPKTLAGKRIRVRGWVELFNGPEFEIATPGAIERLD
jgi:micrococcal nuclease